MPVDGDTFTHSDRPGRPERVCTFRDDLGQWWWEQPLTRDWTGDVNPHGPQECKWPHAPAAHPGALNAVPVVPAPSRQPGEICTRSYRSTDVVGAPCPDCGHTTFMHPGRASEAIMACVVCQMESATTTMLAFLHGQPGTHL